MAGAISKITASGVGYECFLGRLHDPEIRAEARSEWCQTARSTAIQEQLCHGWCHTLVNYGWPRAGLRAAVRPPPIPPAGSGADSRWGGPPLRRPAAREVGRVVLSGRPDRVIRGRIYNPREPSGISLGIGGVCGGRDLKNLGFW